MSLTHRRRNIIIGIVAFIVLILLILLIRGIVEKRRENARERIENAVERTSGSGSSQQSQSGSSGSSASNSGNSGDSSGGDQSGVLAPPLEPPPAGSDDSLIPNEESPGFLEILDQHVTPFRTTPGHDMAFWASIGGTAVSVTMSVADTAGAGGAFSVLLVSAPPGADSTSWEYDGQAPAFPGTYSYSTTAVASDGHSVQRQGGTFTVE